MTKLLFDYDPILFAAACASETKSIKVIHKQSGDELEFKTRTKFYGHHLKKAGGYLAELNESLDSPRQPDEYEIIDVQTPEPFIHAKSIADNMIKGDCEATGTTVYYGYTGKGKVFRHDLATVLEYKGNRAGLVAPFHLAELKDYFVRKHNCTIVESLEVDDYVSCDSFESWHKYKKTKSNKDKLITSVGEKDFLQCAMHLYNRKTSNDVCSYDGFGWLSLEGKDVKGRGRLWLYHQCLSGDDSDNYCANSASALKWGEKSSYKLLKDTKTDQEAFQALVQGYKTLYPSAKVIKGWRGDDIEIDWLYMLDENFNLAKLLRTKDEKRTCIKNALDKLKINY